MNNGKRKLIIIRLLLGIFIYYLIFGNSIQAHAFETSAPNNKFGIHFALPNLDDLTRARDLINSNGGDWGYVTLVIQEDDRDRNKWQEVFDRMREFHLIPIIRLATVPQADQWRRPQPEDADSWVDFLDSLHWVVKDRYIILFNEPNHGAEWGGSVDAGDYAELALTFAQKLKSKSPDFFIMLAGLDASAPSAKPKFEDEDLFLRQIFSSGSMEQWNNLLSGLASHSYPNPDFSGSPLAAGRGSVRTYQWELELLRSLGISKELPVFITETGWKRGDEEVVAENFRAAFENIWLADERVAAVTPFVFDYQGAPFLDFSWKRFQDSGFYPQFYTVQSLTKVKGRPEQIERGEINFDIPHDLVAHSNFRFTLNLKNFGQAVWDKDSGYQLTVVGSGQDHFEYFFSDIKNLKPFEQSEVDFFIKTSGAPGKNQIQIALLKDGEFYITGKAWEYEIFPLPDLRFTVGLLPKLKSRGNDFEIQIFDEQENLVFKKVGIEVEDSKGAVREVQNIILGKKYRVVILKPYYLPRQNYLTFDTGENTLKFEMLLPLDFNKNGRLDIFELLPVFQNPRLINLLFP
ncbi:hypothetical protein A2774_05650 [Candidatus Roizmanbacteria bacterium RIFCSPHIGHO2_01_FULL_39_12c]|uniref:Glycoside hydrolase family 5 domain-containing protein n=1 Tax=Candidatus Roizmanbacteria bacterium RIFCSPHIGHO2_01_FULL_39_12c TaxID=1802031 RepID=A0A1F7G951_9BACT|nr:MAG: hypothetical protein A2774_05650 [Candidatus Roizmanbacteria bacterium RIFCSPHIGHO2_01_FULL_39_12c]